MAQILLQRGKKYRVQIIDPETDRMVEDAEYYFYGVTADGTDFIMRWSVLDIEYNAMLKLVAKP